MLNIKSAKKNERGIALVFSLIFLSLLLILALAFALDSMFDQKAAYNSANASSARFLAEAQLKQVLTMIQEGETNFTGSTSIKSDRIFSNGSNYQDMLRKRLTINGVFETTNITNPDPCYSEIYWNYERNSDGHIIGRTAFIVLSGLPINSLISTVSADVDESGNDTATILEERIGKDVSEINIRDAMYQMHSADAAVTYTISPTMADYFNWSIASGGVRTDGKFTGMWSSFASIFDYVGITGTDDEKIIFRRNFAANFAIDAPKDKEAFWAETSTGDTIIDSNELYKRFDLTRADWSTSLTSADDFTFIKTQILLDLGGTGKPVQPMEVWDNTDSTTSSVGLPWLACFGYKADGTLYTGADLVAMQGTFATVYDRRCQIAANLKDYCDTDNRPTSDVDPANWVTGPGIPKFTGNERTPYINKIGFKVKASQGQSGSDPNITVWANIEVTPSVGLINIYGSDWTENLEAVITGSVTIKTTVNGTGSTSSLSLNCTIDIAKDAAGDWTNNAGYSNFVAASGYSDSGNFNTQTGVTTGNTNISVEVTAINITKIVLRKKTGGDGYDYTKALTHTLAALTGEVITNGTAERFAWFGFAVPDPRQNLHLADWQYLTPAEKQATDNPIAVFSLTGTGPYYGAPNAENSTTGGGGDNTEAPSVGGASVDAETVTDPANGNLSTAFIRNAPMESPWELGFIHRGARWQTINLKTYDSDKAFVTANMDSSTEEYIAGGGLYASGDANILDQIKMTATAKSPQKISLRSQKKETFDTLFSQVQLGCIINAPTAMSVTSMATGGTAIDITDSDYTTMRTTIISTFTTARTRAGIAGDLVLPTGATTDAAKEELIGKIINLTKAGSKIGNFTIIVLAQTIKDVEGTIYKYAADETTSGNQTCLLGTFDAIINTDYNDSIYFDEITAEQKILVTGSFDGVDLKITSFQYID